MSEDLGFSVPDHEAYDVVLPGLRAVLRILHSKPVLLGSDEREVSTVLAMSTLLLDAMGKCPDDLDEESEDGFLIGWGDEEKKRAAHPWVKELWAEHPELRGWISPETRTVGGELKPPQWMYRDYNEAADVPAYSDDRLMEIVDRLTKAKPEGITYKDVARAWWGEDWNIDDAQTLPSRLWRLLRQHARYEKVQSKGPNVWRRTPRVARVRKAA
jgi:hypothetical protein